MTKIIKAFGREHSLSDLADIYVTVPDGETEAHVFAEGKLLGTRSAFEDGPLSRAMKSAEDAAIAKRVRDAGWSLADVTERTTADANDDLRQVIAKSDLPKAPFTVTVDAMGKTRIGMTVADLAPCFKEDIAAATAPIDIKAINKDVMEYAAWMSARIVKVQEEVDRLRSLPVNDTANTYLDGYGKGLLEGMNSAIEVFTEAMAEPDPRLGPLEDFSDPEIEARLTNLEARLDRILGKKRYGIEVNSIAPGDWPTASMYMDVNGGQGRIVMNADKLFVR